MNTLLLLPALFSSHGGIERILRLYVRAFGELSAPGARVAALVLNDASVPAAALAPYATPALASVVGCGRSKLRFAGQTLLRAHGSRRIVCGHLHLLPLAHLARRIAPRLELTLIAHGLEVWRDFTAAERRRLAATDRILCVSDFTRRELLARCPELAPARVHVQPNALDPQFSPATPAAAPGAATPNLILSVARLSAADAYKGIDHLIQALPAIRTAVSDARLRIVGDGDDRTRLERLAREAGVADAVEFAGTVSDAALREHFAACRLFALPSRGEGFGLVYLEAMAHGKPCLAARAGGAPEVVTAETGLLVDYGNVAQLAAGCGDALRRAWDPAALQARARHFSYEAFRTRLASLGYASA